VNYRIDRRWDGEDGEVVVHLLTPYGRTGSEVSAAGYLIEVFVNGATRGAATFTLEAATAPVPNLTAQELVGFLANGGMTCGEPANVGTSGSSITACVTTDRTRDSGLEAIVTAMPDGTVATTTIGVPFVEGVSEELLRSFSGAVAQALFDDDVGARMTEWITTAAPTDTTDIDGAQLQLVEVAGDIPRWELTIGLQEAP
jgi:hypothetical protein